MVSFVQYLVSIFFLKMEVLVQNQHTILSFLIYHKVSIYPNDIKSFTFLLVKTETHLAIDAFTGMQINSAMILRCINLPEDAFLLEYNAHQSFDRFFGWGIEAITASDGKVTYTSHLPVKSQLQF